jgi:oxygen-independent coproporphyrinogen-3 oxidase
MTTPEAGFGIYVHWPFCAAKCPYCDFNSHVRHAPPDQERFARAFGRELATMAARTPGRTVTSIFLGGGTPSLMEPRTVGAVLDRISALWTVAPAAEITLEANPSSVEATRFTGYRAAGVNRVSMGVQALNDTDLRWLGRLHDVAQARHAIGLARSIFPRMSFDLIYARPQQTEAGWRAELNAAIDLAADHLSLYQLTIEAETRFEALYKAGKLTIPDPEHAALLFEVTQDVTAARGLPVYEVSNHAQPGAESRHNLTYWRYGDYVGVGPGAHGRISDGADRFATATEKHPETWLERVETGGHGLVADDRLTLEEQGDEFLLMGLRLIEGIDLGRYERLSGRAIDPGRIDALISHGMIERMGSARVRATPAGFLVLDAVVADLAA